MAKNGLFFYIGAELSHPYDEAVASHERFPVAYFMKELGSKVGSTDIWGVMASRGPATAKDLGVRYINFSRMKSTSHMVVPNWAIEHSLENIGSQMTKPVSLYESLGKALVTAALTRNANNSQRYSNTVTGNSNLERYHRQMEIPLYSVLLSKFTGDAANCSGRALQTDMDHLVTRMKASKAEIRWPLFSVGDCNSFHNDAYVTGAYALDLGQAEDGDVEAPTLIVNFDQHRDLGSAPAPLVRSDGWGAQLMCRYKRAAYVVIGAGGKSDVANQVVFATKSPDTQNIEAFWGGVKEVFGQGILGGARSVYPAELKFQKAELLNPGLRFDEKLGKLWDKILEVIDPQAEDERPFFKNVFITVDRDCMKNNWTQWGDIGAMFDTPAQVLTVMSAIVRTLRARNCRLAGLDITGLPERNGNSTVTVNRPDFRLVLPPLVTELKAFYELYRDNTD